VAISGGSSGGGLFNAEGELVGITTFYLKDAQSLNFAVPVEWIGEVAAKPKKLIPYTGKIIPLKPEWLDRAGALEKAQDWQGLLAHCRRWTQAEPGNYLAWSALGKAYGNLGRHREAIEAFREAVRLKPDYFKDWFNLGIAYGKLDRYPDGIEANREALRLKPDYAEAWNNLGVGYGKLGRRREAIEAFREAVRFKPDYPEAWNNLAIAYAYSGNRSAALEAVKELRRYDPQKADKLFNLIMKP
jgi:tetratricopeptide (TPR) repeat protein